MAVEEGLDVLDYEGSLEDIEEYMLEETRSVEDHLNSVTYDFKGYVPQKEALLFVNFIKEVNDGAEENETPVIHLKMMDSVFNKEPMCAILVFRGAGKTTVFAEYLILFIAAFGYMPGFGDVDFILYVTDSIENGVRNLRRNVEFRYNNSEFLQRLIPNQKIGLIDDRGVNYSIEEMDSAVKAGVRFTDVRLELVNYKGKKIIVRGYGVSTGVRGTKEGGKRPTVAILDDLLTDTDAKSPTIIGNVNDIIYKAVKQALHPTNFKIIYLGTPFNAKDPLYVAIESGAWKASVFPVCERFPVSRKDFRGAWEDRFTYQSILNSHTVATKVGNVSSFYQEMMLRIHSDEDQMIDPKTINQVEYAEEMKNKEEHNFYITTDFATSEKDSADYSVMVIWKHDDKDHLVIVDAYLKKSRMKGNIDALFDFVAKYQPKLVGIEVSGQQGGFIDWIQMEMRRRGEYFTLAKQKGREHTNDLGIKPNKNKIMRLEAMLALFNRGQISICEEVVKSAYGKELFQELELATPRGFLSKHDDAVDGMTQLMDINIFKPSEVLLDEVKPKNKFDIIFADENFNDKESTESSYVI
jgi:predicted phage terminase large subunit-like protein